MTTEKWLPIPEWEGLYEVSDQGRVRSLDRPVPAKGGATRLHRGEAIAAHVGNTGYYRVGLSLAGARHYRQVHRLVALAFHGPAPEGHEVRHLDGDKLNCRASNLAWGTRQENTLDQVRHGQNPRANKTHCPHGHPYSGENLYVAPAGGRYCIACRRERDRQRAPRRKRVAS